MKVLYLSWIGDPQRWSGLVSKLRGQRRAVQETGLSWEVLGLTTTGSGADDGLLFPVPPTRWRRLAAIGEVIRARRPDAILLRYPGSTDLARTAYLREFGARTISEHHTAQVAELRSLVRGPLSLIKWSWERQGLPRWLAGVAGALAVTPEILEGLPRRFGTDRGMACGNGADLSGLPLLSRPAFAGDELHLLFACGEFWPWQGLDRLLTLLARHRGLPRITLHLAGVVSEDTDRRLLTTMPSGVTVHAHGVLDSGRLREIAATCHLGIGTLALDRKGMRQACPLKSREYAAWGLPFIYAHSDPDLDDQAPGCLRLGGDDSTWSVANLASHLAGCPTGIGEALRSFAAARLDWRIKLPSVDAFLRQTLA